MSIPSTEGVGAASYFGATGTTGTNGTATGTSSSSSTTVDKDMFLKLMVEQLKNQDPMDPTDSSAFLAQTAQFTSLEKLEAVAAQSAQALTAQMAFGASGLVGRSITYVGADGKESAGKVDSVRFTSSGPLLGVNGAEVELGAVNKVAG